MNNKLPHDAVERVRAIRERHYEETKHMTREEKWEYDQKRYENAEKALGTVSTSKSYDSWLREQGGGKIYGK